jgi:copper transport protein
VLRWLVLLGALVVFGGAVFELIVIRPALSAVGADRDGEGLKDRVATRSIILAGAALAILGVGSVGQLLLQTTTVHEINLIEAVGSPLVSVIRDTGWGRSWAWRMVLWVALVGALAAAVLLRSQRGADQVRRGRGELLTLGAMMLLSSGVLLSMSLTSHAAATIQIATRAVLNDYLHIIAAGLWVGGLFHLGLVVPVLAGAPAETEGRGVLLKVVSRFSAVAVLSVVTVIATGIFSAWAQVTIFPAIRVPYGWTLVGKVAAIGPLLLLGVFNLLWLRPRLARGGPAALWLRRVVMGEVVLAVIVVLAVGFLTTLEPARQVASRQGIGQEERLAFEDVAEGATIAVVLEPGTVGENSVAVSLTDRLGQPITNAFDVGIRLSYLDADLGGEFEFATDNGGGLHVLAESQLNIAGPWQAEIVVRRPDAFDARTAFRFEVSPGAVVSSGAISPSHDTAVLLLGGILLLIGGAFLGAGILFGGWYSRSGAGVMAPGLVAFFAGVIMVAGQIGGEEEQVAIRNPFLPNPASLETGGEVYSRTCQTCHGVDGLGDGPAAVGMVPPPADLILHVPLHPDRALFDFIKDGIDDTQMRGLGDVLSDEEIWHVINYIQTLE